MDFLAKKVSFRRKPESRVPGENRDPIFEMVPDFRRDDVWMPDQVRHDGTADFNKRTLIIPQER
jgi:hypothetical protein